MAIPDDWFRFRTRFPELTSGWDRAMGNPSDSIQPLKNRKPKMGVVKLLAPWDAIGILPLDFSDSQVGTKRLDGTTPFPWVWIIEFQELSLTT